MSRTMTETEIIAACDRMERLIEQATLAVNLELFSVAQSLMQEVYEIAKTLPQKKGPNVEGRRLH